MNSRGYLWISTDLDGALLDDSYSWESARPSIQRLKQANVPLILNSSKTFTEIQFIADKLEINHPLICENGGVVAVPESSPLAVGLDSDRCAGYWLLYPGLHRNYLLDIAHKLREEKKYLFSGFADWTNEEVMEHTGLSEKNAARAKCRFATEPILWTDTPERKEAFRNELEACGIIISEGGRFSHIMGQVNKGTSMLFILDLYKKIYPEYTWSIFALGDSDNDLEMLSNADIAGVIPDRKGNRVSPDSARVINTEHPGPTGWNEIVEQVLNERLV